MQSQESPIKPEIMVTGNADKMAVTGGAGGEVGRIEEKIVDWYLINGS